MKIIFLNHNIQERGTYWRAYNLGKYLCEIDPKISVTMLCVNSKRSFRLSHKTIRPNFNLVLLPKFFLNNVAERYIGYTHRIFYYCWYIFKNRYNFDILHAFTIALLPMSVPTIFARFFLQKKICVDWDDDWGVGFAQYHPFPINKLTGFLEYHVPRCAHAVTVVSSLLEKKAINRKYKNIVRIGNGSQPIQKIEKHVARQKLSLKMNSIVLLTVGNMHMGNDFLLKSFDKVCEIEPRATLHFVGFTNIADSLPARFNKKVVFWGYQNPEKIKFFLSAADVLLLPMENNPIEHARYPIRLCDYMAAGKPIVSNAVGEVALILRTYKAGLVSSPDDIEDFSSCICKVIQNSELGKKLSKNALQAAQNKLSWNVRAQKLYKLYQEVYS